MKFGQTNMNPYVRIRKVHVCSVCTRDYIFLICTFIPNIVYNIHTAIRFVSISAKFGVCTVVDLNGTLVKVKIRTSTP